MSLASRVSTKPISVMNHQRVISFFPKQFESFSQNPLARNHDKNSSERHQQSSKRLERTPKVDAINGFAAGYETVDNGGDTRKGVG